MIVLVGWWILAPVVWDDGWVVARRCWLVGGTNGIMIGNVIADQFRGIGSNWPLGAALAFVTMAFVLAIYFAVIALVKAVTRW